MGCTPHFLVLASSKHKGHLKFDLMPEAGGMRNQTVGDRQDGGSADEGLDARESASIPTTSTTSISSDIE